MLAVHLIAAVSAILIVGGLAVAIAAAMLRRWPLATRISRVVVHAAATTFGSLLLFTVILMVDPRAVRVLLPHYADPSQAARLLGELIANLMNCGALSVLAGLIATPVWVFAGADFAQPASDRSMASSALSGCCPPPRSNPHFLRSVILGDTNLNAVREVTRTRDKAAQQAVEADGRASSRPSTPSPVVWYHGLARRYLLPPRFTDAAAA